MTIPTHLAVDGLAVLTGLYVRPFGRLASALRRARRRFSSAAQDGGPYSEGTPMLVLSRKRDEVIKIGDDIEITVVDIRGDKVRLGITAPKEVMVHRKEVYLDIQRENREAAAAAPVIGLSPAAAAACPEYAARLPSPGSRTLTKAEAAGVDAKIAAKFDPTAIPIMFEVAIGGAE